ncbi:MAG: hypothetical protein U0133_05800 [Gemmatimonadales bacterium]
MRLSRWSFATLTTLLAATWILAAAYAAWADSAATSRNDALVLPFFAGLFAPVILVGAWSRVSEDLPTWTTRRIATLWTVGALLLAPWSDNLESLVALYRMPGAIAVILMTGFWLERRVNSRGDRQAA